MPSSAFENELLKSLNLLTKEQQNKVIAYIELLLKKSKKDFGKSGQGLLQFAGSFDSKDVQEINSAIEAGCENIDKNEW